jgi:hypothetical protein
MKVHQQEIRMTITMGATVTDKVTGFTGIVSGLCQYLTDCNQALVQPPVDKDGKFQEPRWIDEQRLEVDTSKIPLTIDNGSNPGCDLPAPVR